MKILLVGDTHGDYGQIHYARKVATLARCEMIIQLGDFSYYWCGVDKTHGWADPDKYPAVPVIWLPGNHEDWHMIEQLPVGIPNEHGVTYLGRVNLLILDGLKILTVGGAYSVDQYDRIEGVDYFPQEEINQADIYKATSFGEVDIMLSHDAPTTQTLELHLIDMARRWGFVEGRIHPKLEAGSRRSREAIEAIVDEVKPKLLVHGHYHHQYGDVYMNTQVIGLHCNGNGSKSIRILDTEEFKNGRWRS